VSTRSRRECSTILWQPLRALALILIKSRYRRLTRRSAGGLPTPARKEDQSKGRGFEEAGGTRPQPLKAIARIPLLSLKEK
jgi:hypothetical protein